MKRSSFYSPAPELPAKSYLLKYEELDRKEAEQCAKQRADDAQRIEDKKQARVHDFAVAAFSVALTLLLERIEDVVDFVKGLF